MDSLEALKKIRQIGYRSSAPKATQAVLNILKTAEAGILEAEKRAKADTEQLEDLRIPAGLQKPVGVSEWAWTHHSFLDLKLWQHSIVACSNAGAVDVIGAARKKYAHLGGERCSAYLAEARHVNRTDSSEFPDGPAVPQSGKLKL